MWVFAHRGESAIYPENSRDAILHCDNQEMHGIEIDLQQAGNQFIVFHDRWMMRVLGLQKRAVDLTEEDLSSILGRDGQPLPTLTWLLATAKAQDLWLNIELKNIQDVELFYQQLTNTAETLKFDLERLVISAFNHQYLMKLAALNSKLKLGLLCAHLPSDYHQFLPRFKLFSVHLDMNCIAADFVHYLQQRDLKVFVFNVDQASEIEWLFNQQVDGIFANDPRQAYKIINNLSDSVANL